MRLALFPLPLLVLACAPSATPRPPPADRFYFPTGVAFARPADRPEGSTSGILYVTSSNFDKRFDTGALHAVDLDRVGLPPLGGLSGPDAGVLPRQLADLRPSADGLVRIPSFANEIAVDRGDGGVVPRLFTATRAEGDLLEIVDAAGPVLTCAQGGTDCTQNALSLTATSYAPNGEPAAPGPFGVGIGADGEVWVSHLAAADSPLGTGQNLQAYLVFLQGRPAVGVPRVDASNFVAVGVGAGNSVSVGQRNVYLSGRLKFDTVSPDVLLRIVDRQTHLVTFANLQTTFPALQARGIAVRQDESRLYLLTQNPDQLVVVDIANPLSPTPGFAVVRAVPVPLGPTGLALIERHGTSGDLVVLTSTTQGSLIFYDDSAGALVQTVAGVGAGPYAIAVDRTGVGARFFVSDFADGRVAVVDALDLARIGSEGTSISGEGDNVRLVAHLGLQQACIIRTDNRACGD